MTQDEAKRKVYDGAWPIIAGRRIALNFAFAKPDLVLKLYEPGRAALLRVQQPAASDGIRNAIPETEKL